MPSDSSPLKTPTDLLFLAHSPSQTEAKWIRGLSPAPTLWLGGRCLQSWVESNAVCGWLDAPFGQSSSIARQVQATILTKAGASAIAPSLPASLLEQQNWDEIAADLRAIVTAAREVRPETAVYACMPFTKRTALDESTLELRTLIECIRACGADALVDIACCLTTHDSSERDEPAKQIDSNVAELGFPIWSAMPTQTQNTPCIQLHRGG